ncbi:nitroreductase family protein [Clostridium senegalense]
MANNVLEIIKNRKSVRSFTNELVCDEKIKEILECGMAAPSAMNTNCVEFIVVKNKETMNKLPQMLEDCAAAVVVCADVEKQNKEAYWLQDCAAAMENMLLAVEALELGGVWIAIYPEEERMKTACRLLNVPNHIKPVAIVALGYENEKEKLKYNYEEKKIHSEKWI